MNFNRERLEKLLWLTQSDNDHEALSSIRAVNKMIKDHNLTWSEVFKFEIQEKIIYRPLDVDSETKEMLDFCLQNAGYANQDFIHSLSEGHKKYGNLTFKQKIALRRVYEKLTGQRNSF